MTVFRNSTARVTGVSNLVDLDLHFHIETPMAIAVSLDGDREKLIWLPKSQIEWERLKTGYASVTCTRTLAVEKGLESAVE